MIRTLLFVFCVFSSRAEIPTASPSEVTAKEDISNSKLIQGVEESDLNLIDSLEGMEASWKVEFHTNFFNEPRATNAVVSTEMYAQLNWSLLQNLSLSAQALFIGRNGFTQSIYDRPDRPKGLNLLESFFEWTIYPKLRVQFGIIQQDFLEAPLLITDKTFPSFILNYSWELYDFQSSFLIQTTIPDSAQDTVKRKVQRLEGVPHFSVTSLKLENKTFPIPWEHAFSNRLTWFFYYKLAPDVAIASRQFRNKVQHLGSDSGFRYNYYGLHNHTNFKLVLSQVWAAEVGFEYLNNLDFYFSKWKDEDNGHNEGYRAYLGLYYNYQNFLEIKSLLEVFENRSNSSVAYYNSEKYGHNDRKGVLAELQLHFHESGLSLGMYFVNSQPVNPEDNEAIGSATAVSLFLKTNYITI